MRLSRYNWPGNIRQLQAVLFRAAAHSTTDTLTADDFSHLMQTLRGEGVAEARPSLLRENGVMLFGDDGNVRYLADIEADIIRLAIGHYQGRMTEVARRLGIGRSTLYRKLAELGIENPSD